MLSFKPEAFQVSPQCLQTKDALYILPGGVHVWGYVPLVPSPPLHFFFTPPFPNPYLMIPLLQSKATNSDVQNMYELMYQNITVILMNFVHFFLYILTLHHVYINFTYNCHKLFCCVVVAFCVFVILLEFLIYYGCF
jgi:hypothetical protein